MITIILNASLIVLSVLFIVLGSTRLLIKLTLLLGCTIAKKPIQEDMTPETIALASGIIILFLISL